MSGTAEALAQYVGMDWHVVPVKAGGKRALISGWPTKASADAKCVEEWWTQWPDAGADPIPAHVEERRTGRSVRIILVGDSRFDRAYRVTSLAAGSHGKRRGSVLSGEWGAHRMQ